MHFYFIIILYYIKLNFLLILFKKVLELTYRMLFYIMMLSIEVLDKLFQLPEDCIMPAN